jgi:hypothetical protein
MIPRIKEAAYVRQFTIRIFFTDGVQGEVDLEPELEGEVFVPLRDSSFFRKFQVHPELHTLVWPNGADFAPEFLYDKIQAKAAGPKS